MARPILMPQVGQDLTEGKITAIYVKPGDTIKKGDIVAEVESEKAVFEVEAFETGTILDIRYKVGDMAIVLEPLMMVGEEGERLETPTAGFSGEDAQVIVEAAKEVADAAPGNTSSAEAVQAKAGTGRSSPLARRLAAMAGVEITLVPGTGPHGAVVKRDIDEYGRNPSRTAAAVAGLQAYAASASGSVLKTLQGGTGDPVVFIHGFGGDLSAWRPFILHLGVANPILAVDMPAHGSAADQQAAGFDDLVASVRQKLASDKIERLHLVGHSVGAAVAAALAGGSDLDVRSLTLLAPAGLGPGINGDYVLGFLSSPTEAALGAWLRLLVHDPSNMSGVVVRATLASREASRAMVANQSRLAAGLFSGNTQLFDVRDALSRYRGAARVIVGREDRIIPAGYAEAIPPHVALHRFAQVGHLPYQEAAQIVGGLVAQSIRSAG